MSFTDWDLFEDLFAGLRRDGEQWVAATTFVAFDESVRRGCPALVDGNRGYAELVARLEGSGDYAGREELLFEHLRMITLAAPAQSYGLGKEWHGYWVSKDVNGADVYASDRYAPADAWSPVELSLHAAALQYDEEQGLMYHAMEQQWYLRDGRTPVWPDESRPGGYVDSEGNFYLRGELQADSLEDLREQHFDVESGRWRRFVAQDGEFEYHHTADGVWERWREEQWYRFHDDAGLWLPYHEPSATWLDRNQWRPYEEVGTPYPPVPRSPDPAPADAADPAEAALLELVERSVTGALEDVPGAGELSEAQIVEAVREVLLELAGADQ